MLSMQLHVAVIPLERFVTDRQNMGSLVAGCGLAVLAWCISAIIVALNFKLLARAAQQWLCHRCVGWPSETCYRIRSDGFRCSRAVESRCTSPISGWLRLRPATHCLKIVHYPQVPVL